MALTDDDVRRVARLARLALPDEEVTRCREQLGEVLKYMGRLAEVDVSDVEPAPYPFDTSLPLRADDLVESSSADALLAVAPEAEDRHVVVPKVLG
jgi:aspartyl-tRNA(Asn)/glutamyl-tRNA(Gln) amidotransferase subunit C